MTVSYVYVIAFRGDRFLMVRHARRAWEMPGGKVDPGEEPEAAAAREFREETGYEVDGLRVVEREPGGLVYTGDVSRRLAARPDQREIAAVAFFESLPDDLSFPLVEYERMLHAARERKGN
ncbi:MAG TPA: NUDIX domain-containing protein [Methanocella sp.]|nr:NUDIX domain-containing protein [Methanocella sp.]